MADADFYAKALANAAPASTEGGASSYFSKPQGGLDPHLFDGMQMRPEVISWIKRTVWDELARLGLKAAGAWVTIWVAGSGVSYQWAADRGNGDLDVLLGVNMYGLVKHNPDWAGFSEDEFASWLDARLKSDLWPRTAHHDINGRVYEVTVYLNPGVDKDISVINPYAAYKVTSPSGWSVRPDPDPPHDFPRAWADATTGDLREASALVYRYNEIRERLAHEAPGSARWHDLGNSARIAAEQAKSLFDDIHEGRHAAFENGGHGYRDWANYRWQAAKQAGVISGLKGILAMRAAAEQDSDAELYGGPVASANEALMRAQMVMRERLGLR